MPPLEVIKGRRSMFRELVWCPAGAGEAPGGASWSQESVEEVKERLATLMKHADAATGHASLPATGPVVASTLKGELSSIDVTH